MLRGGGAAQSGTFTHFVTRRAGWEVALCGRWGSEGAGTALALAWRHGDAPGVSISAACPAPTKRSDAALEGWVWALKPKVGCEKPAMQQDSCLDVFWDTSLTPCIMQFI